MKQIKPLLLTSVVALLAFGCSSDSSTKPFVLPAQVGTSTLLVDADVDGADLGDGFFKTDYTVIVRDAQGVPVIDAVVTIKHPVTGSMTLAHDALSPGTYKSTQSSYTSGWYTLSVVRAADSVINASAFAPDVHTITFPTSSDTLSSLTGYTVAWNRNIPAGSVVVETDDFGPTLSSSVGDTDDGTFTIPAPAINSNLRVRVWRKNVTTISVGITGSDFEAEIRNTNEPIIVM